MTDSFLTVPENDALIRHTATAGQTEFSFDFPVFEKEHVIVYQNDSVLILDTDYTVAGVDVQAGGSITLTASGGATEGDNVTIQRVLPIERVTDFARRGDFRAEVINEELDTIAMILQQLGTFNGYAIRLSVTEGDTTAIELTADTATRTNTLLGFDASGNITVIEAGDGITISAGTISATGGAGGGAGALNKITVVTSDTTWTPDPNSNSAQFIAVGGGAGGEYAFEFDFELDGTNSCGLGVGGNSGAMCEKLIDIGIGSAEAQSADIVIGAGGGGGTTPSGDRADAGGDTTVTIKNQEGGTVVTLTAGGGTAPYDASNSPAPYEQNPTMAAASGGDINVSGRPGEIGRIVQTTTVTGASPVTNIEVDSDSGSVGGKGADTEFGAGGRGATWASGTSANAATAGTGYGSGGGGGLAPSTGGGGSTYVAGADGAQGVVIIREYK